MAAYSKAVILQIIAKQKPGKRILQFIQNAFGVHTSLVNPAPNGNPNFIGQVWSVSLAQFLSDLNDLDKSQSGMHLSPPTSTAAQRNGLKKIVAKHLKLIMSDVQKAADLSPAKAKIIIESAGFAVKQPSSPKKNIGVRNTNKSGTVVIAAAEAGFHEWSQKNADGSWLELRGSTRSKKTVKNLPLASSQIFRSAPILSTQDGAWTEYPPIIIT